MKWQYIDGLSVVQVAIIVQDFMYWLCFFVGLLSEEQNALSFVCGL